MKKNVFLIFLISSIIWSHLCADDLIFQDIQQKIDKKKINDVELTKVLETPSLFKNSTIRFDAKFTQIGKLSRVFHTKFDLSEYLNLSVWPDEVKLWQKDGLKIFLPLVFVKKESNNATIIGKLKKYQRIQITGLVTNDYQNQPWIEVLSIKVLDKNALSEEALYHIRLGDKYHYGDHPVEPGEEKSTQPNVGISFSQAEMEYQKALTYDLSDVEKSAVLELLGDVQLKQNKIDESIVSLTEALDISPKAGRSNFLMATALYEKGDYVQAKIYGEKSLDVLSKNKDVLLCNAKILIKLKEYEIAKAYCINANRLDADDIRPYALLGEIYDLLNEYDVSKEMYRRAINLKDGVDNFDLHKNMGHQLLKIALVEKNAKEKENALMQADREFNATINQINDKNPEAFYLWGRVLEEWKSRPKSELDSIDKFNKAIALQPEYFNAHMHKANVLNYRLNKPKDAIASYEKAASIKPEDLNPLKALEKIYREAKSYDQTVAVNTKIVGIDPKNFGSTYALGMDNHLHLNQQAVAVDWFTKALALDLNHSEVEFYLGKSLYLSGKKSESIKHLLNAAIKLPSENLVSYYLGKAYAETNQSSKAIEMLVKYNSLDPANVETRIILSKEYLRNAKTYDLAVKTAGEAVVLAEKEKKLLGESQDAHGWSLVINNQAQAGLPLLEKANKADATHERQYHLGYAYVQLNMFAEAETVIKKLETIEIDKKLAQDVKRLRSELEDRKNKDLQLQKKASEKSTEKTTTKTEEKAEPDKKKSESEAAKAAAREAEKTAKLEEKKRIDREKAKQQENERIAKIEKEKEDERKAAALEEAEKHKKADELRAKEEKKLNAKKKEDDAKKKEEDEKLQIKLAKEKAAKEKLDKELADKKAKDDEKNQKEKAAKDKKDKELADKKAKEDEKNQKEKASKDKKDKELADKKAKEDEKNQKDKAAKDKKDKELADKKAKEDEKAKLEESKKAKALADKAKKEEEDRNKAALLKAKEDQAKKDKLAKEEQEKKDKLAKEEQAKKEKQAKEDAKKAEDDKKKKIAEEKAKNAELEKQKEAERAAILKDAEEKKKLAEKASKERAKATEEAEKLEKQRRKEAEKNK